jgi:hypothetical protein
LEAVSAKVQLVIIMMASMQHLLICSSSCSWHKKYAYFLCPISPFGYFCDALVHRKEVHALRGMLIPQSHTRPKRMQKEEQQTARLVSELMCVSVCVVHGSLPHFTCFPYHAGKIANEISY